MKAHFIGGPEHGTTRYLEGEPSAKHWFILPHVLTPFMNDAAAEFFEATRGDIVQYSRQGKIMDYYIYVFDGVRN